MASKWKYALCSLTPHTQGLQGLMLVFFWFWNLTIQQVFYCRRLFVLVSAVFFSAFKKEWDLSQSLFLCSIWGFYTFLSGSCFSAKYYQCFFFLNRSIDSLHVITSLPVTPQGTKWNCSDNEEFWLTVSYFFYHIFLTPAKASSITSCPGCCLTIKENSNLLAGSRPVYGVSKWSQWWWQDLQ